MYLMSGVTAKRKIFAYYHEVLKNLPEIEFMPEAPYGRSNRWLTVVLITPDEFGVDRETVRLALEAENIEARPVWKPMHLQPVFNPHPRGIVPTSREFHRAGITPRRNRLRISQGKQITHIVGKGKRYKASPSEIRSDKLNARCCDFVNLTRQAVVNEFHGLKIVGGEVAEDLFNRGLCLPSGSAMTKEDLDRVISVIFSCKK